MDYENEPWMKVYKRDTAGWADLDIFARGISLELGRHLNAKGELSLGRKGLPAVAATLRTSWERIEPFIRELLRDGRLVHDEARQVLIDPQHEERQRARTNAATRKRMERDKKKTSRGVTRSHAASRGVTNRSEKKRSEETHPAGEIARATPEVAALAEPEPEPDTPDKRDEDPLERPDWFDGAIAVVEMGTGVTVAPGPAWLRYSGHRRANGKAMGAADAQYWLTTVDVREILDAREKLQRQVDREAKWDQERRDAPRSGPTLRVVPDTPPAPYHAPAGKLVAEREQWVVDAGTDAERKASAAAALRALG